MSANRPRIWWLYGVAAVFVGIVVFDALDLVDDKTWTEINHASHSHFIPKNKDENVAVSDCPQTPPADNELLSSQCQVLRVVSVGETVHYIPKNRNPNIPDDRFPTRPPGSGVIITPDGVLAAADAH